MTENVPWPVLVGEMLIRRIRLNELKPRVYPPSVPGERATDEQIEAARRRLGHPLDDLHRAVLLEGDGWENGFGYGDLLSTDQLGHGHRWQQAMTHLDDLYENLDPTQLPPRDGLYPVHVGDEEIVVVDLAGPVTDGGHPVHWLGHDELIQSWPNLYEYWLSALTYLQRTVDRALEQARTGAN